MLNKKDKNGKELFIVGVYRQKNLKRTVIYDKYKKFKQKMVKSCYNCNIRRQKIDKCNKNKTRKSCRLT